MMQTQTSAIRTFTKVSVLATAALLAVPALAGPAHARGGDSAVSAGSSCGTGVIKVKAKADDGLIDVEGEVDTNRAGQTWNWTIKRNGTPASQGTGRTAAPSGSFSVERRIGNPAGADTIVFRAVRASTGKICRASVTF
jgi:hypothetical protein